MDGRVGPHLGIDEQCETLLRSGPKRDVVRFQNEYRQDASIPRTRAKGFYKLRAIDWQLAQDAILPQTQRPNTATTPDIVQ